MNDNGKQSKFELIIGAVDRFSGVLGRFRVDADKVRTSMQGMKAAASSLDEGMSWFAGKVTQGIFAAGGGALALAKGVASAGDAAVRCRARSWCSRS
jgi:hypothetical protein